MAARKALESLREEIKSLQTRLQQLLDEERTFREELFGAAKAALGTVAAAAAPVPRAARSRRGRRPPRAERYFKKLPDRFTLEDVRRLAGRAAGVSIAQWARAKRIRKVANGYQKIAP
jgi:hypothetical protein